MAMASGASTVWSVLAPASSVYRRRTDVGICGVRCGPSGHDASAAVRSMASKPLSAAVTEQGESVEAKEKEKQGEWSRRRALGAALLTGASLHCVSVPAPAQAVVQIKLVNLKYKPCDRDAVAPGSSLYKAKCFRISGETINPTGLTVYNADVFGFVLDAYDEPALPNRGRLASIKEIPPGKGKFEIEIVVPASETLPLQLKNFRATGFLGEVNRELNPYEYTDNE